MKICQICAVDFTLRNFLLPLIDGMKGQGWQVTAVCSDGPFIAGLRLKEYRVETIRIPRSMHPGRVLLSFLALLRFFQRERFDIVHVHTPVAALIGRLAAWVAGVPLIVYTAHGFYFHDEMPRWRRALFVALERFAGRFTDLLFSQSNEDAADAVIEGIIPAERVLAIGNGVDVSRFDPARVGAGETARATLGIPANVFVVGMIGRLVREKGVVEYLRAAEHLASAHPHVWFLLVGERLESDHAADVREEFVVAKAALGERLVAPGLRGDVPEMLAAMDVFCLPSWREGMPRTIIEAMMMAKPVVATNVRGAREEVIPEETGLLVPTHSPERLAAAIERIIFDPEYGRRMGQAGRQRALLLYDECRVVALQLERIAEEARRRSLV